MIKTKRKYGEKDVYEVLQERLNYLFTEFDNIYVSFSGGKDSGLLLNLTLDFQKKYYPNKKIGVFHQDFEAQYSVTTEYIERTFQKIENEVGLVYPVFFHVGNFVFNYLSASGRKGFGEVRGERDGGK